MDPLRDFFRDRCEFAPGAQVPKSDLWKAYRAYAETSGIRYPLTRPDFTKRIGEMPEIGEGRGGHGGTRMWKGIALLGVTDSLDEDNPWLPDADEQ